MPTDPFIHLHLHTEYSTLDGAVRIKDLIKKAQRCKMPAVAMTDDVIDALTKRTQDGGTEVVAAKAGKGSATLSMAYAGALFADACLRAKNGEANVVECTYVESTVTEAPFFATKVTLGKEGVEKIHGLGELSAYEQKGLDAMMPELKDSINKGVEFAKSM